MSSSAKKVKRIIGALSAAFLTLVLCLVFAEVIIRKIDDYPIFPLRLQERVWVTQFSKTDIAQIARGFVANSSVQLGWFGYRFPNYEKIAPPAKLAAWFEGQAMPFGDAFKIWNTNALEHNLKGNLLNIGEVDRTTVDSINVFTPQDGSIYPRYRFLRSFTVSGSNCRFNNYGFRGKDISIKKAPQVIRIAFVGASTTQGSMYMKASYPEWVEMWLNTWVKTRYRGITFEVINAGREGIHSTDISAIVARELLLFAPDFVIYFAGMNEFKNLLLELSGYQTGNEEMPKEKSGFLKNHSAIYRRLKRVQTRQAEEPPKPGYKLNWPLNADGKPSLDFQKAPKTIKTIVNNLYKIKAGVDTTKAELVVVSFVKMVKDKMILNRTIHDGLYRYWNRQMWPYTYADIAKFSHLQNRIYETFCHNSGSIFIDLAALYPLNPHLFLDGVHTTNAGTKLRAWIVFNQLVPILDKKLSSGELPKEARQTLDVHPVLDKEPWQTMALEDILAR